MHFDARIIEHIFDEVMGLERGQKIVKEGEDPWVPGKQVFVLDFEADESCLMSGLRPAFRLFLYPNRGSVAVFLARLLDYNAHSEPVLYSYHDSCWRSDGLERILYTLQAKAVQEYKVENVNPEVWLNRIEAQRYGKGRQDIGDYLKEYTTKTYGNDHAMAVSLLKLYARKKGWKNFAFCCRGEKNACLRFDVNDDVLWVRVLKFSQFNDHKGGRSLLPMDKKYTDAQLGPIYMLGWWSSEASLAVLAPFCLDEIFFSPTLFETEKFSDEFLTNFRYDKSILDCYAEIAKGIKKEYRD